MTYILMALFATIGTWLLTLIGASFVFIFKKINNKTMASMYGFGGGVMIAAAFFSLLLPAIEMLSCINSFKQSIIIVFGFITGVLFIIIFDKSVIKKVKKDNNTALLIFAISLHNIPEGMAIGVAFASIGVNDTNTIPSAILLALGIGIQNIPEGMAISFPLYNGGMSKKKSFFYGQLSALVEPIGGLLGAILVSVVSNILPFILCFASGAMIYAVIDEIIPEGHKEKEGKLCTFGFVIGFSIMMLLDISFS